jgi:hypothetical protein
VSHLAKCRDLVSGQCVHLHLPPLPLDIRLWEEGLANCFNQCLFGHVAPQLGFDGLTLASYGFAFGTGGDDMPHDHMRQWLAGMANE